ncbi:hypothetical protein GCM10023349_28820 [Nocardioides conyzicola]|uniref:Uncharacterized protein n=1 Tax=Nocardioides conyzicola TaxID=1651781 RepID=A0ABP8XIM2_9ACTN
MRTAGDYPNGARTRRRALTTELTEVRWVGTLASRLDRLKVLAPVIPDFVLEHSVRQPIGLNYAAPRVTDDPASIDTVQIVVANARSRRCTILRRSIVARPIGQTAAYSVTDVGPG